MKFIQKAWLWLKEVFLFFKQISILLILIAGLLYWLQSIIQDKQEEQQVLNVKQKQHK